jgi:hypothetical protein
MESFTMMNLQIHNFKNLFVCMFGWLVFWLGGQSVVHLAGWLVSYLVGHMFGWFIVWFVVGWLDSWLAGLLVSWFVCWLVEQLAHYSVGRLV